MASDGQINIDMADVRKLLQVNPLAAEQLKNIALQRRVAELERKLAEASGESADGRVLSVTDDRQARRRDLRRDGTDGGR